MKKEVFEEALEKLGWEEVEMIRHNKGHRQFYFTKNHFSISFSGKDEAYILDALKNLTPNER